MLELYFLFYRIPKMMTQLARERQRSALAWSLLAIGAWLGAEIAVGVGVGLVYAIITVIKEGELSEQPPAGLNLVAYIFGLGAAIGSFYLVKKILTSRPKQQFEPPPPTPTFQNSSLGL